MSTTPLTTPLTTLSDQALVSHTLGGCLDSFSELVTRHQTPLLRFLRHRTPTREDAEDLTQEAFVRAFVKLDRYRPEWSFATWLFTLARRMSIDHYVRCKRSAAWVTNAQCVEACVAPGGDPALALAERERRIQLWKLAAAALSEPQWSSLWLYYAEDLSLLEISRVVNCTPGAVKALLHRGRRKLAAALVAHETSTDLAEKTRLAALHPLVAARCARVQDLITDLGLEKDDEQEQ